MPAATQFCAPPVTEDPAASVGSGTRTSRRNSRLACTAAARKPSKCAGLRICSPPEYGMLSPEQSGAARRRAGPRASRAASPGANRAARQPQTQTPAVPRGGPEGGFGKVKLPPLSPAPLHATLPNQTPFLVCPAFPLALRLDPGTPGGAPVQMERKEGSDARARKEPPRLPAIA